MGVGAGSGSPLIGSGFSACCASRPCPERAQPAVAAPVWLDGKPRRRMACRIAPDYTVSVGRRQFGCTALTAPANREALPNGSRDADTPLDHYRTSSQDGDLKVAATAEMGPKGLRYTVSTVESTLLRAACGLALRRRASRRKDSLRDWRRFLRGRD